MKRALRFTIPAVVIIAILFSAVPASAKAKPPGKRYYVALMMGLEGPYSVVAGCMRFTAAKVTVLGEGVSGPWEMMSKDGNQTIFTSNMATTMEMFGQVVPVTIDGIATTDDTGDKSAMGGALNMIVEMAGVTQNVAMAGREVANKTKCKKLAKQFNKLFDTANASLARE